MPKSTCARSLADPPFDDCVSALKVICTTLLGLVVLCGGEAGIKKRISSGPDIPWVEILSPRPAQLLEDGSFDNVDLAFVVHGMDMGPELAIAEVFVLRSLSSSHLPIPPIHASWVTYQ